MDKEISKFKIYMREFIETLKNTTMIMGILMVIVILPAYIQEYIGEDLASRVQMGGFILTMVYLLICALLPVYKKHKGEGKDV